MRILSKFKDYYDHVQQYGTDSRVTYVRDMKLYRSNYREEYDYIRDIIMSHHSPSYDDSITLSCTTLQKKEFKVDHNISKNYLYFCGKLYIYWIYSKTDNTKFIPKTEYKTIWNAQELIPYHERFYPHLTNNILRIKSIPHPYCVDISDGIFIDLQAPILVTTIHNNAFDNYSGGYTVNPCLKTIGFHNIMEPEKCYQELEMYISGHLNNREDMVEISNDSKMKKHGMDKTSFRRDIHPSKPRGKNKL